ncbi:hypothetical protein IW262DRAFT_1301958 [Armillaria fumosa]|nr:hypothetical protein IW262DRAFT_1301958 [Armillaria fumosa]
MSPVQVISPLQLLSIVLSVIFFLVSTSRNALERFKQRFVVVMLNGWVPLNSTINQDDHLHQKPTIPCHVSIKVVRTDDKANIAYQYLMRGSGETRESVFQRLRMGMTSAARPYDNTSQAHPAEWPPLKHYTLIYIVSNLMQGWYNVQRRARMCARVKEGARDVGDSIAGRVWTSARADGWMGSGYY